jgi:antitoxin component YwqK of YwqJK toxin-antitoxin module
MRETFSSWIVNYLILPLPLLALTSCAHPEVLASELIERNGIAYQVDSNEPFTGSSVKFHENGQLKNRTNYRDGEKEGLNEWFWENGQLGQTGSLKGGKKDGPFEMFNQNGELTRSVNYKNGVRID